MTATKQEFWAFHKANPSVYKEFEKYTNVAIDRGAKHLSHWLVIGRIRYETAIETNDPDYKINNNYIAFYARLFMALNPQHDGFFKTKLTKQEKEERQYANAK